MKNGRGGPISSAPVQALIPDPVVSRCATGPSTWSDRTRARGTQLDVFEITDLPGRLGTY
jgi:hypothetical protein